MVLNDDLFNFEQYPFWQVVFSEKNEWRLDSLIIDVFVAQVQALSTLTAFQIRERAWRWRWSSRSHDRRVRKSISSLERQLINKGKRKIFVVSKTISHESLTFHMTKAFLVIRLTVVVLLTAFVLTFSSISICPLKLFRRPNQIFVPVFTILICSISS